MSLATELSLVVDAVTPHAVSMAMICARLLPVAFLCPLLGGAQAPMHVKWALVLALAGSLHVAAGVSAPPTATALELAGGVGRELLLGSTLGLIASLPFDAARIGGRFIDLFRGSSAEAALPLAGSKEAASGEGLYHLLLALAASGLGFPVMLSALWKSFALVTLGAFVHSEAVALDCVALVSTAFATGLAVGAPFAGLGLAVDALIGLLSRASPQVGFKEVGAPVRILAGGALLWLAIGVISERLLAFAVGTGDAMRTVLEAGT